MSGLAGGATELPDLRGETPAVLLGLSVGGARRF